MRRRVNRLQTPKPSDKIITGVIAFELSELRTDKCGEIDLFVLRSFREVRIPTNALPAFRANDRPLPSGPRICLKLN